MSDAKRYKFGLRGESHAVFDPLYVLESDYVAIAAELAATTARYLHSFKIIEDGKAERAALADKLNVACSAAVSAEARVQALEAALREIEQKYPAHIAGSIAREALKSTQSKPVTGSETKVAQPLGRCGIANRELCSGYPACACGRVVQSLTATSEPAPETTGKQP